ncbi:MAG TPA: hypothetical protein VH302_01040 [Bryobacteraceae bacterium]|nr:hypothetical protein [Bryobacteraceae bacterium]
MLTEPRLGIRARITALWRRVWTWIIATWCDIKPGPETRKGALWAAFVTVIWGIVIGAINLKSGFGLAADVGIAIVIAGLGIPLIACVFVLILALFRRLPRWTAGFFVGAFLFLSLLWWGTLAYSMSALLLFIEACAGATLATFFVGHFRAASLKKKTITAAIFALAIAANIGLFFFMHNDGVNEKLIEIEQRSPSPQALTAADPADKGPFAVRTLIYGAGTDIRRPEYGKSVAIRTQTVDGSALFKDFSGWKAWTRKLYWGFGVDKLPLNGRVWFPVGQGPFPLVLMVHGNHTMSEFSDPGYAYLGELMASRGFIFVSVDENFLNGGFPAQLPKEQATRGWMLLEHLKVWQKWNATTGNPFFGKVDMNNIAVMGHSRGGEAAATAALFNKLSFYPDDATVAFHYGFPIKAVLAIAPADGQYKPAGEHRVIQDVNYFTLQGANDSDVSSFMGSRQYDNVRFTGSGEFFKSELYIYRANHGQFNTVWGRTDSGAPMNWFLNLHPLLTGEDQRRIAKLYISAFLETTLHNRREYLPIFRDYRVARAWLPRTLYENRYLDSTNRVIADFGEDTDVTTTTAPGGHIAADHLTVWREGRIPFRHNDRDYNGVFIGWNRTSDKKATAIPVPVYSVDLPANAAQEWRIGSDSALTFSIAITDEKAPPPGKKNEKKSEKQDKHAKPEITDFDVIAQTADGDSASVPVSQFRTLLPPIKVKFTKLDWLDKQFYSKSSEPVFQSIMIPLSAFVARSRHFDPSKLTRIRLQFARTPERVIIISEIGVARQ